MAEQKMSFGQTVVKDTFTKDQNLEDSPEKIVDFKDYQEL